MLAYLATTATTTVTSAPGLDGTEAALLTLLITLFLFMGGLLGYLVWANSNSNTPPQRPQARIRL